MNNVKYFYNNSRSQFYSLLRYSQQIQSFCNQSNKIQETTLGLSDPINLTKRKETQEFLINKLQISKEDVLSWDKKSGKMLLFNQKETLDQKINLVMERLECDNQRIIQLVSRTPKMFNPQLQQLNQRLNFWLDDVKCNKSNLRQAANFWIRPIEEIEKFCEILQKKGFENPKILLNRFPKLATYSYEIIDQKIEMVRELLELKSFQETLLVFERNPKLWGYSREKLIKIIEWFGDHMFTRQESYQMIENDPEIVDISTEKLSKGWKQLLEFYGGSEKIARQVVIGRPTNLTENLNSKTQKQKFQFLKNELGMSAAKVLEECPLITRYSLKGRLAPRLLFLRTKQKKEIGNLLPLLMLSDDRFVKSIGNCELAEFQGFVEKEFEEFQWPLILEQLEA